MRRQKLRRSRWSLPNTRSIFVALSILVASFRVLHRLDLGARGPPGTCASRVVVAAITMGAEYVDALRRYARLQHADTMAYDIGLTAFARGSDPCNRRAFTHQSPERSPPHLSQRIFMGLNCRHALHRHGGHAGTRAQLRPTIRCALRGHSDRAVDGALWAHSDHASWAKAHRAVVMGLAIPACTTRDASSHFYRSHPGSRAQVNASLDQTNLALGIAGITLAILAFARSPPVRAKRAEEALA